MRRIVRARINTAGFGMVMTEIAGRGLHPHAGDLASRMRRVVEVDRKWMQVDVAIGTVVGAQAATDAPVLDDDFQGVAAADGTDRATNHAEWISTLAAGSGDQVFVEAESLAHQAADSVMCVGARSYALITAGAPFQIEHKQALRFHQTVREELVHGQVLHLRKAQAIFLEALPGNQLQAASNVRKAREHQFKVVARNAHSFHMVQGLSLIHI